MFRMTEGYFTLDLRFIPRLPLNGPLTVNFFGTVVLYTYPHPDVQSYIHFIRTL